MSFLFSHSVRFQQKEYDLIKKVVKENPNLYETPSQFLRCAAIKLLREHEVKL